MVDTILTTAELTLVDNVAANFERWPTSYRNWCPTISIDPLPYTEFYALTDANRPAFSKDGSYGAKLAVAKTKGTANTVWIKYDIEIPYAAMVAARKNGTPLLEQTVSEGLTKVDLEIESLIFKGLASETDAVAINGLCDVGTDTSVLDDANAWDTPPAPFTNMRHNIAALEALGYTGPYTMVASVNLKTGAANLHNAAADKSHIELARELLGIDTVGWAVNGTSTDLICYPLPAAAADDGVALYFQTRNPDNFRLAEAWRPRLQMYNNGVLNPKTMCFEGKIDWMGTIQILRSAGIMFSNDVDLA